MSAKVLMMVKFVLFLGRSFGKNKEKAAAKIKSISQIISTICAPAKKLTTAAKNKPIITPPANADIKSELASSSWRFATSWAVAADDAGMKNELPAKYKKAKGIEA